MATAVDYMKTLGFVVLALTGLAAVTTGQWYWSTFVIGTVFFTVGVVIDNIDLGDTLTLMQEVSKREKSKPTQPKKNHHKLIFVVMIVLLAIGVMVSLLPKPVTLEYGSQVPEVKPVAPVPEPVHDIPAEIGMMNQTSQATEMARYITTIIPVMVVVVVFGVAISVFAHIGQRKFQRASSQEVEVSHRLPLNKLHLIS